MAAQNLPDIPVYYQNNRLQNEFDNLNSIGTGAFGKVYSARHRIDLKNYAIKAIKMENENDYLSRIREIQVWAKLDCHYFVQYRSSWLETQQDSGINLYVQMDLCWFTMADAIKKIHDFFEIRDRKLLPDLAYYIGSEMMTEVVQSVDYLHSCVPPIFHRDIKPHNILVRADRSNGRFMKLADFGLARFHESEGSKASNTRFVGSLRYMAPEIQYNLSPNNPDTRTRYGPKVDIYSVGVVFQELFNYDLNSKIPDPAYLPEKYGNLIQLIDRMMSANTRTRPTGKEILDCRDEWAMKFADVSNEVNLRVDPNIDYDISTEFIHFFLKTKLEHQR